jgi:hypothetical protein
VGQAARAGRRRSPRLESLVAAPASCLDFCLSIIFSENQLPPGSRPGQTFSGSCSKARTYKPRTVRFRVNRTFRVSSKPDILRNYLRRERTRSSVSSSRVLRHEASCHLAVAAVSHNS